MKSMIKTICVNNTLLGFELHDPNDLCLTDFKITTNVPDQLVNQYYNNRQEAINIQSQLLSIFQNDQNNL